MSNKKFSRKGAKTKRCAFAGNLISQLVFLTTMNKVLLLIAMILLIVSSCKKNSFITGADASVNFSVDTIYFDTVFTSTGSITQSVKIINNNDQKLLLSDVKLMGGNNSVFKININGAAVLNANNIEIDPNDSIYVFVSVFINPNGNELPFILQDSIQVAFNGNTRYIQLQAYGQNAHFLSNQLISGNINLTNDLTYDIIVEM